MLNKFKGSKRRGRQMNGIKNITARSFELLQIIRDRSMWEFIDGTG